LDTGFDFVISKNFQNIVTFLLQDYYLLMTDSFRYYATLYAMGKLLQKLVSISVIIVFLSNTCCYGLAALSASQNPAVKMKTLAALARRSVRCAESPEAINLLHDNNAECLLLCSGDYLVTKEVSENNLRLLRAINQADIKPMMQILQRENFHRYHIIKETILKYFPYDRNSGFSEDFHVNHIVARAFGWLLLVKEGVIHEKAIAEEDKNFIDRAEHLIKSIDYIFLEEGFWDRQKRTKQILKARRNGMLFYDVPARHSHKEDRTIKESLLEKGRDAINLRELADKIYSWYTGMRLAEHEKELCNLGRGLNSLDIKNGLKNLVRARFTKLLSIIPNQSIKFLGAGTTFIAFEIENTGLVIKIPVMGTRYFGQIEQGLRKGRLKLGDRLAGTVEYLDNIEINLSKFSPDAKRILLGRIEDDVLGLKRDVEYEPIIDPENNVTVNWLLIQKRIRRLIDTDMLLDIPKGFLIQAFHSGGKGAVKKIIDDLFLLLNQDAYPRGVYPAEIKFSSFGYLADKLVLFDIDIGHKKPRAENMFTTGILNKLDPTGELSSYYREKMSSVPASINSAPVLAEDLDFSLDGINTEAAEREYIGMLLSEMFQHPPYTIARDFDSRIAQGENARRALKEILKRFNIILETDRNSEKDNQYLHITTEALSIIPIEALNNMSKSDLKTIKISKHEYKEFLKYSRGILYVHPSALSRLGAESFISELYKCLGRIFLSTIDQKNIDGLSDDFRNINMRGEYVRAESKEKGCDLVETEQSEEFTEYLARFFANYILQGDKLRRVVNGELAYASPYAVIRPSLRRIYDLFKVALGWKEYVSLDLAGLKNVLDDTLDIYDAGEFKVLWFDVLHKFFEGGATYKIKYDASRLSPSQISIVEEYARLLNRKTDCNFKAIGCSSSNGSKEALINVYREDKAGNVKGEGHVDVDIPEGYSIEQYMLRIAGMVNLALAAANIEGNQHEERTGSILGFIKRQCQLIVGSEIAIPKNLSGLVEFIKNLPLPKTYRMPTEKIEEYNRNAGKAPISA